jgi:hypothetical protein
MLCEKTERAPQRDVRAQSSSDSIVQPSGILDETCNFSFVMNLPRNEVLSERGP